MSDPHNDLPSNVGTILKINGKLLYAAFLTGIGVWLWPDDLLLGYGWVYIAIVLWCSSIGLVYQAARLALEQWLRDRRISKTINQGVKPKSTKFASIEKLREAGLIK